MGLRTRARRVLERLGGEPQRPRAATSPRQPPPRVARPTRPPPRLQDHELLQPALLEPSRTALAPELQRRLDAGLPLAPITELVHPGIVALPLLDEHWPRGLRAEMAHLEDVVARTGMDVEPPNSMNDAGVVLAELGFTPFMQWLCADVLTPVARELFPDAVDDGLTDPHAFVVAYGGPADRDLGFHVDDSELTVNLCLGDDFDGSGLYFEGRRCALHRQDPCRPEERFVWHHRPGVALLHLGAHRHGVLPIQGGSRRSLIVWARDPSVRRVTDALAMDGRCPSWCESDGRRP